MRNSVMVLTSDHGEGLGEHGEAFHGRNLYSESIDIPLVIWDTDFTAPIEVEYARQIDIAPTIVDLVGVPAPESWEGQSLLSSAPTLSFHQTTDRHPLKAAIWRTQGASYKYLVNTDDGSEQLFELITDPGEHRDRLLDVDTEVLTFLRRELQQYFSRN